MEVCKEQLWFAFVTFLKGLQFVVQWSATLEESLKSSEIGRVHLHAFVEFRKSVDWSTLESMRFDFSLPNASPTTARGSNQRKVVDQGHFYVWANKRGTLKVATSQYTRAKINSPMSTIAYNVR